MESRVRPPVVRNSAALYFVARQDDRDPIWTLRALAAALESTRFRCDVAKRTFSAILLDLTTKVAFNPQASDSCGVFSDGSLCKSASSGSVELLSVDRTKKAFALLLS